MSSGIGKRRAAAKAEGGAAYQERRREVVKVAAKVFKERGYQSTSLGDIAERLETDRASLYYYVSSKEELFGDVVIDVVAAGVERAEAIRDSEGTAPEKLRLLMKSTMASYEQDYPLYYVYIQENITQFKGGATWLRQMRGLSKRNDAAVLAIVQGGLDDGSLRSTAPARVIVNGLFGMMNWSHRWFRPNEGPSAEAVGDMFAEMLLTGLVPPKPRRR